MEEVDHYLDELTSNNYFRNLYIFKNYIYIFLKKNNINHNSQNNKKLKLINNNIINKNKN